MYYLERRVIRGGFYIFCIFHSLMPSIIYLCGIIYRVIEKNFNRECFIFRTHWRLHYKVDTRARRWSTCHASTGSRTPYNDGCRKMFVTFEVSFCLRNLE